MNFEEQENTKEFLKELAELSMKHGIVIGGCGCCGSPHLNEVKRKGHYEISPHGDDLSFVEAV